MNHKLSYQEEITKSSPHHECLRGSMSEDCVSMMALVVVKFTTLRSNFYIELRMR